MMELVDIDINEDNLDFSQVIIIPVLIRIITMIMIVTIFINIVNMITIAQVCQIAARFQDEGDERQV